MAKKVDNSLWTTEALNLLATTVANDATRLTDATQRRSHLSTTPPRVQVTVTPSC